MTLKWIEKEKVTNHHQEASPVWNKLKFVTKRRYSALNYKTIEEFNKLIIKIQLNFFSSFVCIHF